LATEDGLGTVIIRIDLANRDRSALGRWIDEGRIKGWKILHGTPLPKLQ